MSPFWSYFFGTFYSPRKTFEKLHTDSRQLSFGFKSVMLMGVLYTLTTAGYAIAGATPLMPTIIGIPSQKYYFWQLFYEIPVFAAGWFLASGCALLICKLFKGEGTLKTHLAILGFALNIPWYITWLVDTVIVILYLFHILTPTEWAAIIAGGGTWQIFTYCYPLAALVWLFVLTAMALKVVEKLRWWLVFINSIITVVYLQTLMTIFIR